MEEFPAEQQDIQKPYLSILEAKEIEKTAVGYFQTLQNAKQLDKVAKACNNLTTHLEPILIQYQFSEEINVPFWCSMLALSFKKYGSLLHNKAAKVAHPNASTIEQLDKANVYNNKLAWTKCDFQTLPRRPPQQRRR